MPCKLNDTNISPIAHAESGVLFTMLAFDIETTGLDVERHSISIVCTEDLISGKKTSYEFARCPEKYTELREELIQAFNQASSLCAFNGVRFDIPFTAVWLKVDDQTVVHWLQKTTDILEQCRLRYDVTFKLDLLCECNGIRMKTGDGLQAIRMVNNKQWDNLLQYCAVDVEILCDLYRKRHIALPRNGRSIPATIDLAEWSRSGLYEDLAIEQSFFMRPGHLKRVYESMQTLEQAIHTAQMCLQSVKKKARHAIRVNAENSSNDTAFDACKSFCVTVPHEIDRACVVLQKILDEPTTAEKEYASVLPED